MQRKSIALLLVIMLAACAGAYDKAVNATLVTAVAGHDVFLALDDAKQAKCVADAKTKPEGQTCLDAWKAKTVMVDAKFTKLLDAVKAARAAKDDPTIVTMLAAAQDVAAALKTIGIGQ